MCKLKTIMLSLAALFMAITVSAQTLNVSGKVTDSSNLPLEGVTVFVKGTSINTSTDFGGNYAIAVQSGQTLVFSFIGFNDSEVVVTDKAVVNVIMQEDAAVTQLEELMVVGYGSQTKRTVTSAITKVKGDELRNTPVNSAGDALKGKVSGARVYSTDNSPGAEPTILIRGGSSIDGSNSPLILVDGIERDLSGINPNDIESMEILKDAASTAIYGSRASNGVVLVTTRAGSRSGAPRITFEGGWALSQNERVIEYVDAETAISLARVRQSQGPNPGKLYANNHAYSSGNTKESAYSTRWLEPGESIPAGYKSMQDPLDPTKTLIFQDTDWVKETYDDAALWQNYYIGVDGGTETVKYMASLGYTDDEGVAVGTNFSKFTARTNLDIKLHKKLTFKAGLDFNQMKTNAYASQYQVINRGLMAPNTQKLYYDAGEYVGTPTPGPNSSSPTPVFYSYYNDNFQTTNKLGLNGTLVYDIIDGLTATAQATYYNYDRTAEAFERANIRRSTRVASSSLNTQERQKLEAYLSYNKTFNEKHSLSAVAGYSYQLYKIGSLSASTQDASSDKIPTLNAGSTINSATSVREEEVTIGYFGRLQYDFKKKYMVMLTFRNDGSSRFSEGNQWGFFPGASVGWVISEENFFKNINVVNNLKLRASYGQTGNNFVGYYDALGLYGFTSRYDGNIGLVPSSMVNNGLTWETSTQLDVGFDLALLNNRIQLSADYFNKITENLITSKTLPNTSGFGSVKTNLGEVRYRGFDVEINTTNIDHKNFSWSTKFVWSYVKNEVLKLPENGRDKNRIGGYTVKMADGSTIEFGGTAEGEPLGRYYGYKTDYIITTKEQAANAHYDSNSKGWDWTTGTKMGTGKKTIGDYEWCDLNGDGIINGNDMYLLGNVLPHSTGGLGNTFTWKNFTLNIYLDWALGHVINNSFLQRQMCNFMNGSTSLPTEILKCWDPESGMDVNDAKYARYSGNDSDDLNKNFEANANTFAQKGDYLCIRDVSLQYMWASEALKRAKIQNITFTLSGNNLKYFTEVIGMSPEQGTTNSYSSGFNGVYPPIRRFSLGVKVTF